MAVVDFIPILLMITFALIFAVVLSKASEFLGPKNPSKEKMSTYESGMTPIKTARERFSVKFYLVAMLFIVFDVEIVFLYPWAVAYRSIMGAGLIEMIIFVVVLFLGYIYILKKGALQWD